MEKISRHVRCRQGAGRLVIPEMFQRNTMPRIDIYLPRLFHKKAVKCNVVYQISGAGQIFQILFRTKLNK